MISMVFVGYALAHLALFGWALRLLLRYRSPATVPLLIVTFGLIYDNAILAAGSTIGHGPTLQNLSVPRYFMHAFGTPLLMLAGLGLARRSGSVAAGNSLVAIGVIAAVLAMIVVGAETDLLRLDLEAKAAGDLVSYGNRASAGPPIAALVTIAVLIAAGIIVWRRGAGPWLLAGAIAQTAAAALADAVAIAGNLGELSLMAGLISTDQVLATGNRQTRPAQAR